MKDALLGAKWSPPAWLTLQAVVPPVGLPSASVQSKAAPPHSWTSIPKCCLYQAPKALGSFAWKKTPPIPVTRFISVLPDSPDVLMQPPFDDMTPQPI